MHPFSNLLKNRKTENLTVFWCFQGVEKGYNRNEWVKTILTGSFVDVLQKLFRKRPVSESPFNDVTAVGFFLREKERKQDFISQNIFPIAD